MTWDLSELGHKVYISTVAVHVLLFRVHGSGMSDKQFVYADRAVFSTSKLAQVCLVALFINHKYAWDDVILN